MGTIIDDARTHLARLDAEPLREVDSLILSAAAYFDLSPMAGVRARRPGVRIGDLARAENYDRYFAHVLKPQDGHRLLTAMAANPRFRDVRVFSYTTETSIDEQKQFCAMSFALGSHLTYVAFRGTDASLVGWKEDFNMSFQYPVPAQRRAAAYLDHVAAHRRGQIIVGGHSKGGNLAEYAAAHARAPVRARLGAVYNHDGPGFPHDALDQFSPVRHIFRKTVPQSALVGLLMSSPRRARVVRATTNGILAHYPYTWRVEDGDFVDSPLNKDARGFDRRLTRWLAAHPRDEAELLIEALYGVATSSSTETVPEMVAAFAADLPFFARSFTSMGREAHAVLRGAILDLLPFPGR